jgi:hypothetical protein
MVSPLSLFTLTSFAEAFTVVTVPVIWRCAGAGVCADAAENNNAVKAKMVAGYFMKTSLNDGILNSKGVLSVQKVTTFQKNGTLGKLLERRELHPNCVSGKTRMMGRRELRRRELASRAGLRRRYAASQQCSIKA